MVIQMILQVFQNNKQFLYQKLFHIEKVNIDQLLFQLIMDTFLIMYIYKKVKYTGGVHVVYQVKIHGVINIVID